MKRTAFFALGICYALALGWAWQNASLSGLAGAPGSGNALAAAGSAYTGSLNSSCRSSLASWVEMTVRSRVAFEYPSAWAFANQAEAALARYAENGCPSGSFLVAGRMADDLSRSLRNKSGLARADLTNQLW